MKTKHQHLKENIFFILLFSIPHFCAISTAFAFIEMNSLFKVFTIGYLMFIHFLNTADKWYADYQISEIEKQVKSLKDNSL